MKDIGFFEVVELFPVANEPPCGEATIGQVVEEHVVRNQARYGDDPPAGVFHEHVAKSTKIRDLIGAERQGPHAFKEFRARTSREKLGLSLEQRPPYGMLRGCIVAPALVDRPIRVGRRLGSNDRVTVFLAFR